MKRIIEANAGVIPVGTEVKVGDSVGEILGFGNGVYRILVDDEVLYIDKEKIKII